MGTLTMTSVRITYQVSGGSANVFNWTGSLASMQTDTVTLPVAFTIAAGTYSFTATTSLPNGLSDQNPSNDSKTKEFSASSLPVSSNFSADATESCDAPLTVQFTNTSTNTSTYLWNFGDGNTSTDMNPTYVYASLGTYNVNLTAYAGICGSDSELKSAYIQVGAQAPLTTDASRCGPGSVTLAASGTGVLNWFASSTGGSIINTGVSYNTPSLSATTTYYVSTTVDGGTAYAAKTSSSTAGGYFNNAYVHGLYFDALQPFVLITAKVYANSTASRKFVLINGSGVHIDSVTVSIPSGESRITLNMNIPAGQNMSLVGPTSPNLWRDGSTTSSALPYPYTLPGVLSITKSTAGSPNELIYYYYLYDWEIELPDCSSARTPVTAYIYSTAPVASFNVAYAGTTVNFTNTSQNGATYQWNFGDGNTSTDVNPSHTYSSVGTYNVMLISTNNCSSDTTWQQVNIVTTGISEEFSANIEIYPNPVNDQLFVKTGNIVVDKIVITDILGKVTGEIVVSEKLISIDVSAYQAGVYFVRIYAQGATATYRITKTR
jgi:PKD repeat protein